MSNRLFFWDYLTPRLGGFLAVLSPGLIYGATAPTLVGILVPPFMLVALIIPYALIFHRKSLDRPLLTRRERWISNLKLILFMLAMSHLVAWLWFKYGPPNLI